jgi:hypothetical protein
MSRVKYPPPSRPNADTGNTSALEVKTGCAQRRVAPATPNRNSEPERWPQSTAAQPARVSARTVDGESARRLSEQDPNLTFSTVARAPDTRRNDTWPPSTGICGTRY